MVLISSKHERRRSMKNVNFGHWMMITGRFVCCRVTGTVNCGAFFDLMSF